MPTTSTAYGKEVALSFNGVTVINQTNSSINQVLANRDVSTKQSGNNKESRPTIKSRTFDVKGLMPQYQAAISTLQNAYENLTIGTWQFGSGFTGEPYWSGSGYFTSLKFDAPDAGNVEYSGTIEVTGAVTFGAS